MAIQRWPNSSNLSIFNWRRFYSKRARTQGTLEDYTLVMDYNTQAGRLCSVAVPMSNMFEIDDVGVTSRARGGDETNACVNEMK